MLELKYEKFWIICAVEWIRVISSERKSDMTRSIEDKC